MGRRGLTFRITEHVVLALLEDIADYAQTPDEAQEELVDDGVSVSAFLSRVQQAVDQQK